MRSARNHRRLAVGQLLKGSRKGLYRWPQRWLFKALQPGLLGAGDGAQLFVDDAKQAFGVANFKASGGGGTIRDNTGNSLI